MNSSVASAIPAAVSAFGTPAFTKHAADGTPLAADSDAWAFVRVTLGDQAFDVLNEDIAGGGELTFEAAQRACTALDLLGSRDWRLPTRRELLALVDDTRYRPAANPQFFPNLRADWYWTGTVDASSPADCAWGVYFGHGLAYYYFQDDTAFVRAVRSVPRAGQ